MSALGRLRRWIRRLFLRGRGRAWVFAGLWFAVGTARSRRLRRFLRSLPAHPPPPALLPHRRVALLFGVDEFLPRIAMAAARPPITVARPPSILGGARRFGRFPQLSAREVFHLRVGMFLFDALESWK